MPSRSTSQSLNALLPGTVLRDYIIESELGSGGFSIVYLARHHLNPDWLYAIKEFLPGELAVRARDGATVHPVNTEAEEAFDDGLRRFRDEAEQLRKFRNEPYIVSCLNYFGQNGTAYLVMDNDDGLPLLELLRRREKAGQPFTEKDLLAVVEPLLEGLTAVHRAGVLHRDIKPGNIFVRRQDDITGRPAHPVLIDFGAAKQNYLARHSRSRAPYTPGYAAYEQVSSEGDIGPWTDVYAVGALMWRMVAGGCPGDNRLLVPDGADDADGAEVWSSTPRAAEKRAYALHRGRPDPMVSALELGAGRFSRTLLQVIDRCLALYPEDRVQNCDEVHKLLDVRTGRARGSRGYHTQPSDDTEHADKSSGQSAHADRFGPGATLAGKKSKHSRYFGRYVRRWRHGADRKRHASGAMVCSRRRTGTCLLSIQIGQHVLQRRGRATRLHPSRAVVHPCCRTRNPWRSNQFGPNVRKRRRCTSRQHPSLRMGEFGKRQWLAGRRSPSG